MPQRRSRRGTTTARAAAGGAMPPIDPSRLTIFEDPEANVVPGEVLVTLSEDAAAAVANSIPSGPSRGLVGDQATTLGVETVDDVLADLGVRSITRLHPPA